MKKLIIIILVLLFTTSAFAAVPGKVYQKIRFLNENMRVVIFQCIGNSGDGTIPDTDTNKEITRMITGWYLVKVLAVPGATTPTALSDVYIKDTFGEDLLEGDGVDILDDVDAESIYPRDASSLTTRGIPITGVITLDIDNQNKVLGLYEIQLVFDRTSE